MIAASRAAQTYRRVESESRSPLELVVMLYDGALRFVNDAREAHARKDVRARGQAISKTLAIIGEGWAQAATQPPAPELAVAR